MNESALGAVNKYVNPILQRPALVEINLNKAFRSSKKGIHSQRVLSLMSEDSMLNSILLFPAYGSILKMSLICFTIDQPASFSPDGGTIQS